MSAATKYYNFMEGSLGLGKNGTHLAHAGIAGGATWALGEYGGIEQISSNWWAPFAGAFAGLGLSITARALLVDDGVTVELVKESLKRDLKGRKLSKTQREELSALMVEVTGAAESNKKKKKNKNRDVLDDLDLTGTDG